MFLMMKKKSGNVWEKMFFSHHFLVVAPTHYLSRRRERGREEEGREIERNGWGEWCTYEYLHA